MTLQQLPRDVHRIIIRYCRPQDIISCLRLVSTYWNLLSHEVSLWKALALRDGANVKYLLYPVYSWEWLWRITCLPLSNGIGYYEYSHPDGTLHRRRGSLIEGNLHGYGICETSSMTLIGHWRQGSPYGNGTLLYRWGGSYVGEFVDWLPSGYGVFTDDLGSIYQGMFQGGLKDGFGLYSSSESSYSGYWRQGLREGFGSEIREDGSRYTGQFRQDNSHGYGRWDISENEYYVGQFVDDVAEGEGTWVLIDGSWYTGCWKNGLRSGWGTARNRDGDIYTGEWNNDFPVDPSFQCRWNGVFLREDIDTFIPAQLRT